MDVFVVVTSTATELCTAGAGSVIGAVCRATLGTSLRIDYITLHLISSHFSYLSHSCYCLLQSLDVIFPLSVSQVYRLLYDHVVAHFTNIGYTLYLLHRPTRVERYHSQQLLRTAALTQGVVL